LWKSVSCGLSLRVFLLKKILWFFTPKPVLLRPEKMSRIQNPEECDARDDDQGTEDGKKNPKSAIVNLK